MLTLNFLASVRPANSRQSEGTSFMISGIFVSLSLFRSLCLLFVTNNDQFDKNEKIFFYDAKILNIVRLQK